MDPRQIIEDYEAERLSADEALELSNCVSLVALYQLLEQDADNTADGAGTLVQTDEVDRSAGGLV